MQVDIYNTDKKYDIIYADPPWSYKDKALSGERGACCKYDVMTIEDILNLPIKNIEANNCILFMWVTMPFLKDCFKVIKSWGFNYKTCGFCWVKKTKNGKNHLGMGHYTRGNAELCLIGIKGKKMKFKTRSLSQIVESKIREHSRKPDEVRDKIVELCGDIPRIELFARQYADGWDCWGNEV